jgi:HEXXH motif-containing protein
MLTRHRLAAADFAALAAGLGSSAAVASLRSAALSRRLASLRAVCDAADQAGRKEAQVGMDLLCDIEREDRAAVAEVLSYPFIGAWVAHCLRLFRGAPGDVWADTDHLRCIAAAAAIRAARPFSVEVPVRDGGVHLPGLGRLAVTGGPVVTISSDGSETTADGAPLSDPDRWQPVRWFTARTAGHSWTVALDDVDPFRGPRLPVAARLDEQGAREWEQLIGAAWEILACHHPEYAQAIGTGLTAIVPLTAARANRGINATSRESFGAAAMSPAADPATLAAACVHEFQHGKLNAVLDLVTLYTPSPARYYAPWRQDPRPLGGLLHGAYAYLGVADFWRVQADLPQTPFPGYAQMEFARWSDRTRHAIGSLLGSADLTELGTRFVLGMRDRTQSWVGTMPSEPAWLARVASADHRLGWRLRNSRPDSAAVAQLADAWSCGAPAPLGGLSATEFADGSAVLGASNRLDLINLKLREPRQPAAPGPDLAGADVRLLSGDAETAAVAYRAQIELDQHCLEAWAGLALALSVIGPAAVGPEDADSDGAAKAARLTALAAQALLNGPEYVYAVYLKLLESAGSAPDPEMLAGWLAAAVPVDPFQFSDLAAPSRTR